MEYNSFRVDLRVLRGELAIPELTDWVEVLRNPRLLANIL